MTTGNWFSWPQVAERSLQNYSAPSRTCWAVLSTKFWQYRLSGFTGSAPTCGCYWSNWTNKTNKTTTGQHFSWWRFQQFHSGVEVAFCSTAGDSSCTRARSREGNKRRRYCERTSKTKCTRQNKFRINYLENTYPTTLQRTHIQHAHHQVSNSWKQNWRTWPRLTVKNFLSTFCTNLSSLFESVLPYRAKRNPNTWTVCNLCILSSWEMLWWHHCCTSQVPKNSTGTT